MRGWLKTVLSGAAGIAVAAAMAAPAAATPAGTKLVHTDDDITLGTSYWNHAEGEIDDYVDQAFGPSDVDFLGYVFNGSFHPDATLAYAGSGYGLTLTGGNGTSGTWTFDPGNTGYEAVGIEVIAQQPGKYHSTYNGAIYALNSWANSGSWDTDDLAYQKKICNWVKGKRVCTTTTETPDLYKLLVFGVKDTKPKPTRGCPEPASIALFGAGLAGLGLRRRKRA